MEILKSVEVPFPADTVYRAWVSSDTVIPPATGMDINPIPGGHYRLFMETADLSMRNEGTFLQVTPGKHVRYSWEWNGDGEVTEIDVKFVPISGGTEVRLRHSGFHSEQSRSMHDSGWDSYFSGFIAHMTEKLGGAGA